MGLVEDVFKLTAGNRNILGGTPFEICQIQPRILGCTTTTKGLIGRNRIIISTRDTNADFNIIFELGDNRSPCSNPISFTVCPSILSNAFIAVAQVTFYLDRVRPIAFNFFVCSSHDFYRLAMLDRLDAQCLVFRLESIYALHQRHETRFHFSKLAIRDLCLGNCTQ